MNRELKKYIYIIATICVVFFVISIVFKVLPWLLLGGFISYIIIKIMKFIKIKSGEKDLTEVNTSKDNENNYNTSSDDYINGEVIDVEYEDVDVDNSKD
jgi:predicted membrane protein